MKKEVRLEKIADLLEEQIINKSISDYRIMEKVGVSNGTFYKLKPTAMSIVGERAKAKQQLINDTQKKETIVALQTGLKSKLERVLKLQNLIEQCEADIQKINDAGKRIHCRKIIKDIQTEISKIEGDYIVDKKETVDDTPVCIKIGYGNLY